MNFTKRSKKISLQSYVNLCKKNYTKFMGIDIFPCFEMIPIRLLMNEADKNGVGAFATQFYDTKTGKQTLGSMGRYLQSAMQCRIFVISRIYPYIR